MEKSDSLRVTPRCDMVRFRYGLKGFRQLRHHGLQILDPGRCEVGSARAPSTTATGGTATRATNHDLDGPGVRRHSLGREGRAPGTRSTVDYRQDRYAKELSEIVSAGRRDGG